MKNFPIRGQYELKINIRRKIFFFEKNKIILLKYKEASILEVIDFLQSEKKIIDFFSDFILKNSNANKKDLGEILISFDKIWEKLENTYLKGLKEKNKKEVIKETSNKPSGGFNSYITLLSEKLSCEPLQILNKYTLAQLNYFTEGIIFNSLSEEEKVKQSRKKEREKEFSNLSEAEQKRIKDFISSD